MDYENMRVAELKALTRECGLRGYSRLRKAELTVLLQNNPPATRTRPPTTLQRPSPPPPPQVQLVRFRPDRGQRAPTLQRPRFDSGNLVHKKWIYSKNRRCSKIDHKSRANLMIGTIG